MRGLDFCLPLGSPPVNPVGRAGWLLVTFRVFPRTGNIDLGGGGVDFTPPLASSPQGSAGSDRSLRSSSPEESGDRFVLQQDSKRRATLLRILTNEAPSITAALQESQVGARRGAPSGCRGLAWKEQPPHSLFLSIQGASGTRLGSEHLALLLGCLRSYIQRPARHRLRRELLALQERLREDGLSLPHLRGPLLGFQAVVSTSGTAWGRHRSGMAVVWGR